MKIYKVEVTMAKYLNKHIEIVEAETELDAIDKVYKHYAETHKEILDIKVV